MNKIFGSGAVHAATIVTRTGGDLSLARLW